MTNVQASHCYISPIPLQTRALNSMSGNVGSSDRKQLTLFPAEASRYPDLEDPGFNKPTQVGIAKVDYQKTRQILTRATGFMDEYDYTLNPYSGCSFGCTYCYAAFFAVSKIERNQWGYWVKVKENAVQSLRKRRPGSLDDKLIYMSSVTDPYQPIERKLQLTRQLLEIFSESHKPKLVVQTRSPDVVRDIELFNNIVKRGGQVQVNMTVTTDDEDVRATFEPFCPSNKRRLDAISEIARAGIQACTTITPLIWVSDANQFAQDLIETGIDQFIVQPFHLTRGKFVAGTRKAALQKIEEKLGDSSAQNYNEHYKMALDVLRRRLQNGGAVLGEGKKGFSPPF